VEPTPPQPPPAAPPPGAAVIRSFPKGAGPQTRYVPFVPPAAESPALTPIPLVTHCPRCGEEAGPGQFCARCGQPLGQRGTQVIAHPTAGRTPTQASSAAVEPGRARLVLERGAGREGATFRLDGPSVAAGRSKGAVTFPGDPCLAPHHATFLYRDGVLQVRDDGAPGGVLMRLRGLSVPLRAGDVFALGDRLLRYAGRLPPAPAAPPDGTRRLGAPRPPGLAIVIEEWLEGGVAGRTTVRGGPSITIGRTGCAVNLGDDPFLSQAHAEILVDGEGSARLRDLGSSNGTFVRIPPHAERELRDGDCLRLGREVLRVSIA
jgi:pSer/pThr/pTyr-binding forkhead associated (FHA) protein